MKIAWVLIALSGCGGAVTDDGAMSDGGARKDAQRDAKLRDQTGSSENDDAGAAEDAYPVFHDDACTEQDTGPPTLLCDPLSTLPQCPRGEGCYPIPPRASDSCHPGRYGTQCLTAGNGTQGSPCGDGSDCAGGFICVKSNAGDQCVKLCLVDDFGSCGDGRICREVDVTGSGYGGCE